MRLTNTGRLGVGTPSPQGSIHVRQTGEANLILEGDINNSGDTGVRDVNILMLTDGGAGNDPFGGTTYGAHGYRIGTQNYAGKTALGFDEWHSSLGYISRLQIDEDGNVGIGIDSPSHKFHVYHPTTNVVANFESGDNQTWINLTDDASGTYGALLGTDSDADHTFAIADNGVNKRLVIKTNGNVGINVDSPTEKLEVDGGLKISNANSRLYFGTEGGTSYRALEGSTSGSLLQVGEGYSIISLQGAIETTDNLKVDGRLQLIDAQNYIEADQTTATRMKFYLTNTIAGEWKRTGSGGSIRPNQYSSGDTAANLPALASYDDEDTGVFFPEADKVGFAAGGNNVFTVKSTGQIEARGEVTGTRIVASVQNMFHVGAEKSEHDMLMGTGRTYVDGGSSNYQGYRFANENWFPPVYVPYSPNQVYRISASMYQLTGSTASGGATGRHYFGLAGYDENFNFLQTDGIGTYQYILGSNVTVSTGNFLEMDVTMKGWQGSGGTDGNKMDQGTVYIRPLVLFNYQNAGAQAILTGFTIMPAGTVADNDSNAGTNY